MQERFEEMICRATEALCDDRELKQEIAKELQSHLEGKCADLQEQGMNEAESIEQTLQAFGDPEDIGAGLFRANASRIKWRSRARLAVKVLALPVLLMALALAVDYRTLFGIGNFHVLYAHTSFDQPKEITRQFITAIAEKSKLVYLDSPLSGDNIMLFGSGENTAEALKIRKKLCEEHPDDPVYLVYYVMTAWSLAGHPVAPKAVTEALKFAVAREPGNALYHYLLAGAYLPPPTYGEEKYVIKDWKAAAKSMEEYRKAIACPYLSAHLPERSNLIKKRLYPGSDFHDQIMRKVLYFTILLPQESVYLSLARAIPLYADKLIGEGRRKEAKELLDTWPKMIEQVAREDGYLIQILVAYGMARQFNQSLPPLYEKLGEKEIARKTANATARIQDFAAQYRKQWNERKDQWTKLIRRHGGWFAPMCDIPPDIPLDASLLKPDHAITYNLNNMIALAISSVLWFLLILAMSIWLSVGWASGWRGMILCLKGKAYLRIFLFGILIPLALYITGLRLACFMEFVQSEGIFLVQAAAFAVILPLWFCRVFLHELRRRQAEVAPDSKRHISVMTALTNLIPAMIVFLLVTGGILRTYYRFEIDRNLRKDQFFFRNTAGIEEFAIKPYRSYLLNELNEFKKITGEVKDESKQ